MGGWGSDRHWDGRRTTVEQCFTLDVDKLMRAAPMDGSLGEVCWYRDGKQIYSAGCTLEEREYVYVLTLYDPVAKGITLATTMLWSGGEKYWFVCPNCRCRVGKLHLPYGKSYFLCRHCYNLTYESCQESHRFDSLFLKMGVFLWMGRSWLKRRRKEMVPSPVYGGERSWKPDTARTLRSRNVT